VTGQQELAQCVSRFATVIISDSNVALTDAQKVALSEALLEDVYAHGVELPTWEEIQEFVMGDDDGEVPESLMVRYPTVQEFLEEVLT